MNKEANQNGDIGRRIFIIIIFAFFIGSIAFASHFPELKNSSDKATSKEVSSTVSTDDTALNYPSAASTSSATSLTDIPDLRNSAKEEAINWAIDNMEQYGKVSGGTFSEQTGLNSYTLRYDYRVPNVFNANEKHVLYLIYTENGSEWQLHAATADGESLQITEK